MSSLFKTMALTIARFLMPVWGALAMSACSDVPTELSISNNGDGTASMTLQAPDVLQSARAVNPNFLRPVLRVNGVEVEVGWKLC